MNKFVGQKYFKIKDDNTVDVFRIMKFKNSETIKIKNENSKEVKYVNINFLEDEEYILLNSDATLVISIVNLKNNLKDIICALYRTKTQSFNNDCDIDLPYCVCRQNVNDFFGNQIKLKNNDNYVGCCMSKDTCPNGVDYQIMLACNEIDKTFIYSLYLNDKFDDIMELVSPKIKLFDNILESIFNSYLYNIRKNKGELIYESLKNSNKHNGYCRRFKDLLIDNNFMYDFRQAFKITPLNIDMSMLERKQLTKELNSIIESIILKYINNSLILKYDKDIDLSKIKNNYILLSDIYDDIYVIVYSIMDKNYVVDKSQIQENIKYIRINNSK